MTLLIAEDVSVQDPQGVAGSQNVKPILRENRVLYENPAPDFVDVQLPQDSQGNLVGSFPAGSDIDLDFTAGYDLGDTVVIELWDKAWNTLQSATSQSTSGTVTFTNVTESAAFVVGWVEDTSVSPALLVSDRDRTQIIVGGGSSHPDLESYAEAGSAFEQTLISIQRQAEERDDFREAGQAVLTVVGGYMDLTPPTGNSVRNIERHIDLIAGLRRDNDAEDLPLTDSEIEAAANFPVSRLFPQQRTEPSPYRVRAMKANFEVVASNVVSYTSPNGARGSGDPSEIEDLQNAAVGDVVYDETREQDVTYDTQLKIDERIAEIEDIITGGPMEVTERGLTHLNGGDPTDGFDPSTVVDTLYNAAWFWVTTFSHRSGGFEYLANLKERGRDDMNQKRIQIDTMVTQPDYGVGA